MKEIGFSGALLGGIEVIVDRYLPTKQKPKSLPKTKSKRIRRKWVKRYGYIELPLAYMFMGRLLCNQLFYDKMQKGKVGR